jgi:Protein of unknown function DUF262/Putative DNA-binding domain
MADLASQPTSIQSLYSWYSDGRLLVNRRYQRKLVWTLEEKQKLIESILRKYPIPAVLLAEPAESKATYEIIDGLQRLHTILSFIETSFPTLDGKLFTLKFFPTAKSRADEGIFAPNTSSSHLSQKEVSTILDYTLAISVMRNASEAEINDVFDRINTYGHRLSDQERRQAGIQNDFSNMVRTIACTLRGDVSADILPLEKMPSISIDLPMTKHGYYVQADDVFWVEQGILRSTDLRDSMDEQCIADVAACIVGGELIERSKDALDDVYVMGSTESERIIDALEAYGAEKFATEFKYCVDQILQVCNVGSPAKLRDIVFKKKTTNAFPSIFAILLIAVHEILIKDKKKITDFSGVKKALTNLDQRIETGRKVTSSEERRKNIDTVRGLITPFFIRSNSPLTIYGNHATSDIEEIIRRSEIELADFELKQGLLQLSTSRKLDSGVIQKVLKTICGIANNGPNKSGKILIGVTDKTSDAARIKKLDGIEPKKVGKRMVVGVKREATLLGISMEAYVAKWRDAVKHSALSDKLKSSILSNIDFNAFYGLGVVVFTVPAQKEVAYLEGQIYWRNGDSTELAATPKQIADIVTRF